MEPIINFKYKRRRVDDKRYYELSGTGLKASLPSVTTILDKTRDPESMEALARWKREHPNDKSAEIGTAMHLLIEDYIQNHTRDTDKDPVFAEAEKHFKVYKQWLDHFKPKPMVIEKPVYWIGECGYGFAGTVDLIAVVENKLVLIDHKSAKTQKRPEWLIGYKLQAAAYMKAIKHTYGVVPDKVVINIATKLSMQTLELDYYEVKDLWVEFYTRLKQFYREYPNV
jgi:ATP-dependent exoDNAse (exonuclease V) beta subunit